MASFSPSGAFLATIMLEMSSREKPLAPQAFSLACLAPAFCSGELDKILRLTVRLMDGMVSQEAQQLSRVVTEERPTNSHSYANWQKPERWTPADTDLFYRVGYLAISCRTDSAGCIAETSEHAPLRQVFQVRGAMRPGSPWCLES